MAGSEFRVTDPRAPREAVAEDIRRDAEQLAADASSRTPVITGRMAGAYHVEQGDDPATQIVTNDVYYARFVEYGTRNMRAEAPLGRAAAAARARGR